VTNRCNLYCRTCIRNDWDVNYGRMSQETYDRILAGLKAWDPVPEVFFAGFGEPLVHPHIVEWVRQAKALGASVQLMRRNVREFPQVLALGKRLGAVAFSVSNLMAYTEAMQPEALYAQAMYTVHDPAEMDSRTRQEFFGARLDGLVGVCPFVRRGSTSVRWDGLVSPCWPLLYDHETFLGQRRRRVRAYHVGSVLEHNEEDCFGNEHPTCGGCLWAQGFIQCP